MDSVICLISTRMYVYSRYEKSEQSSKQVKNDLKLLIINTD